MSSSSNFYESVEDFVQKNGGDHAIKKILVANNGIGAIKAIRSIRKWAFETFGNERMIQFVVMATPEDFNANAEFVRAADEVVDVPGGTNNNNYANINLICEIASRLSVDAVMPMWGHASENPLLPTSLLQLPHRVTFVGPAAAPMQALGDKIGSTIIAQSAGVPTIAWNGNGLTVDYKALGCIPSEVYDRANVTSAEEALRCAERIGYPVMIKASEGGGGKGIRKVTRSEDVALLYRQVQSEIPGSPIFVMKMASKARHLEVQLLADSHGDAIALSGRDCSVQRRHQKIIEEGPPTAASPAVFKLMEQAAVALAKTVGYCNAGTVEYLFMEEDSSFAFLELNPRLQVEHPVTENILGINLPSCQLQVAMGLPLHRIQDVRRLYGRHPLGRDSIDFDHSERVCPPRHCIAVRVTAENPDERFQPTSGHIRELQFRSSVDVWGYFSVDRSSKVHEFADSQFGHIFASGRDRESARRAMVVALKELTIRGEIRTTIEYITKMIQSPDFVVNRIDTAWLDARIERHKEISVHDRQLHCPPAELVALCGAALQGFIHFKRRGEEFTELLQVGQVPAPDSLSPLVAVDLIFEGIKYSAECTLRGTNSLLVECNRSQQAVTIRALADGGFLIDVSGKSHSAYCQDESAGSLRLVLDGHTCMFTPEYDPTRLCSTVAGKLARLLVPDGAHVAAGEPYVEIEVMKMYMPLKAPEAGRINFQMSEGASLIPGDLIASLELDCPDRVIAAELFRGQLTFTPPTGSSLNAPPHVTMRGALAELHHVLDGYLLSTEEVEAAIENYLGAFEDRLLPAFELEEVLSVLRGRIDQGLFDRLSETNGSYRAMVQAVSSTASSNTMWPEYPASLLLSLLHEHARGLPGDKRTAFTAQTNALWTCIEQYLHSTEVRKLAALQLLVDHYLRVERLFDGMSFTDVVTELRKTHAADLPAVLSLCRSHVNLPTKNKLLIRLMEEMRTLPLSTAAPPQSPSHTHYNIPLRLDMNTRRVKLQLKELARLRQPDYIHVSFTANLLLINQNNLRLETRRQRLHDAVTQALTSGDPVGQGDRIQALRRFVDSDVAMRDLLLESLRQRDKDYRVAVMEVYLLKIYQATHELSRAQSGHGLGDEGPSGDMSSWIQFTFLTRHVSVSTPRIDDDGRGNLSGQLLVRKDSESILSYLDTRAQGLRHGLFVAIDSYLDLPRLLPLAVKKLPLLDAVMTSAEPVGKDTGVGVNALHIALVKPPPQGTDEELSAMLGQLLESHYDLLWAHGVRRVTFLTAQPTPDPDHQRRGNHGSLSNVVTSRRGVNRALSFNSSVSSALSGQVSIFTFRQRRGFKEDALFRHIEAPHAFHLDLHRLAHFSVTLENVPSVSGNVFLYRAVPLPSKAGSAGAGPVRYFARLVSFAADPANSDAESLFVEALDIMGIVMSREEAAAGKRVGDTGNHVYLNIVTPDADVQLDYHHAELRRICTKYWEQMVRLAITAVELRISGRSFPGEPPVAMRLVATNPTGFVLRVDRYKEETELTTGRTVFRTVGLDDGVPPGPWDGLDTQTPYEVSQRFERKRAEAMAASDTLYVYDWPALFESGVERLWAVQAHRREANGASVHALTTNRRAKQGPVSIPATPLPQGEPVFMCRELVLCDAVKGEPLPPGWTAQQAQEAGVALFPVIREPGLNDCGMVAWLLRLRTPECSAGGFRELVVICNDITWQAGSFGTKEDALFFKASEYARARGLPRFFLAANSGARIGMAASLKDKFKVAWADDKDPSKGFRYLYLDQEDYEALLAAYVSRLSDLPLRCSPLTVTGPQNSTYTRYVITDIIGEEPDLGVENLMGSGLIAGATARAYDDIFTLTLVVGRTVGIGAYLVRLGQRTVQRTRHSPIILTGYQALNKLMGREIYTTNDQLGGPMIMFPNGVSHLLAETHMDAVFKALTWLAFVPTERGAPLPMLELGASDVLERPVQVAPSKGLPYDPRTLLCGVIIGETHAGWEAGFLDRDSFVEALGGWAKTVVVGRGRLGGIPLGVIVTENRTAEATQPADPADSTSREKMVQQAGGVWFPDSAYKTAQALRDFNREGLPCIVFANWRGFSGGQRDMFDEVLKFGSMIVDALVAYQHPLFVYIPPFAELRGGAWVVVDSTINEDVMEFYAAQDARGGVLEAAGAASIKFRDRDILLCAHRLDHRLIELDAKLNAYAADPGSDPEGTRKAELQSQINKRERMLFGVFQQVAVHFADLHDTPGRMEAKGVIRRQVQWAESRVFFHWRLRRRLVEFQLASDLQKARGQAHGHAGHGAASAGPFRKEFSAALRGWFLGMVGTEQGALLWEDDKGLLSWLEEPTHKAQLEVFVSECKVRAVGARLGDALIEAQKGIVDLEDTEETVKAAVQAALQGLTPAARARAVQAMKAAVAELI